MTTYLIASTFFGLGGALTLGAYLWVMKRVGVSKADYKSVDRKDMMNGDIIVGQLILDTDNETKEMIVYENVNGVVTGFTDKSVCIKGTWHYVWDAEQFCDGAGFLSIKDIIRKS